MTATPENGTVPPYHSYVPNSPPVHQSVIVALKAKLNCQKNKYSELDNSEIETVNDDDDDDADSTHSYPIKCKIYFITTFSSILLLVSIFQVFNSFVFVSVSLTQ